MKKLIEKYEEAKNALIKEVKEGFGSLFKDLFDKFPEVDSYSVGCWTDYFNDGDALYYHVRSWSGEVMIGGDDFRVEDDFDGKYREFSDVIEEIPEDLIQDAFGDHIRIVVSKDLSVSTEDYTNHD